MLVAKELKDKASNYPEDPLDLLIVLRCGNIAALTEKIDATGNPFLNTQTVGDDSMIACQVKGRDFDLLLSCDELIESIEDNSLITMIDD